MKIIVIGSANMDLVIQTARIPEAGETIHGNGFFLSAGGKGANQAVASARMGAETWLMGKVGDDIFGRSIRDKLVQFGVRGEYLTVESGVMTGVAAITVCGGNNRIILDSGANNRVTPAYVEGFRDAIQSASAVMLQLEIPLETVYRTIELAKGKVPIFLNPAPALPLDAAALAGVDYFTPNEIECRLYTNVQVSDVDDARAAVNVLKQKGIRYPLVTLGEKGVVYHNGTDVVHKAGRKVQAVDTTAAGDTFSGTLAAMITAGKTMDEAVDMAQYASSISVTRRGAQDSIPYLSELPELN
ncbi:ribokinase [Paenibacillus darwinianus]|uniref:Ribokinase n=1 Tax=Paenibacillus darwinianus TaxID=1380763 RepID=A0A9W5S2D1_9BACL|nr:ribokinase [Paenibacillus darwinianus]EXX90680.1 ribokinase [Paenibacillus darwinianus]EXX91558.1 ribokinase [Paenibacillus darwinianus]EXX92069.1 ribokinase [Paenibacillus darwinianus]